VKKTVARKPNPTIKRRVTAGRSASYRTPKPKRFFVRESPRGLSLDDLFEKDLFESRPDEEAICRARRKGLLAGFGKSYRLVDLFSGAGGMTLGFSAEFGHSFVPVWANDIDAAAAATYNANFGQHCTTADIVDVLADASFKVPAADAVIGGPPCQGFSLLNKQRDGDPRKQLWRPFLEVVKRSGARVFVMENVPQLLGSCEHGEIREAARALGFETVDDKLCAADYGTPQTRWRAVIIGARGIDPGSVFPPKRTHLNPKALTARAMFRNGGVTVARPLRWLNVRDAVADLPPPEGVGVRDEPAPLDLHFGRTPTETSLKRYRAIPKEGMNRFDLQRVAPSLTPACWIRKKSGGTDLFGRLWWDRPAFTIRTEFFKPEKGRYLHPVQHRPITHREAARFQGFPDTFRFTGSKIEIAKQIGNAVPPPLAARIADSVFALLLALDLRE
jgi:DNA (cytosine-5)-methyltransferase 1